MAKKPRRPTTGGLPIQLDEAQLAIVRKLCLCHSTIAEIASVVEVTERTLYNWLKQSDHPFAIAYHKGRAEGQILTRQLQFKSASRGCTQMLIHLGKQYLGQTDEPRAVVNVVQTTSAGIASHRRFAKKHRSRSDSILSASPRASSMDWPTEERQIVPAPENNE